MRTRVFKAFPASLFWMTFSLVPTLAHGTEQVIYSFAGGGDGSTPLGPLVRDSFGNFYGVTSTGGGACGCGTVFRVTASGKKTTLYVFAGETDGAFPNGGLAIDSSGNLYGTTSEGGGNFGTVFKIEPLAKSSKGSEKVLHSFDGSDGGTPRYSVSIDHHGNLYGTASAGGQYGGGTAFRIDPAGKFNILHAFGTLNDGASPTTMLSGARGIFYSTTNAGGDNNAGTIFKMTRRGEVSVLYTFAQPGGTDGFSPNGDLVQDSNGVLYGTTPYGGGNSNEGTVYSLAPNGTEVVLHSFAGGNDGAEPSGGLVRDGEGNLFGTTAYGGPGNDCFGIGCGTVFKLGSDGAVTILYTFSGGQDGSNPTGTLITDGNNGFYGTTAEGGTYGYGTVFWVQRE